MSMIYDYKEKKMLADAVSGVSGVKSMIGWQRLGRILEGCGQIYLNEELTHLEITPDGLYMVIGYKKDEGKPAG